MKMQNHALNGFLAILLIATLTSCNKKSDDRTIYENDLVGFWVDTIAAYPTGYYINKLDFDKYGKFTEASYSFGIYSGQAINDLSGWYVRNGTYTIEENKIDFLSKKVVTWDSFSGGEAVTTYDSYPIFEDCSFSITSDTLEIRYITYPADAPINTLRHYQKYVPFLYD
jgi:hypothetical protein